MPHEAGGAGTHRLSVVRQVELGLLAMFDEQILDDARTQWADRCGEAMYRVLFENVNVIVVWKRVA